MAPTPATTNIMYVDYSGLFGARTFQVRFKSTVTSDEAYEALQALFMPAVENFWATSVATTGFRWRAQGTTFSLPVAGAATFEGANGAAYTQVNDPRFVTLNGRGLASGHEVRLFLYGGVFTTPTDYRLSAGDASIWTDLVTSYEALAGTADACTDAGDVFVARSYLNVGFNSYYERKARTA